MWWKKNKWKVIVPIAVIAVLAAAFWYGGGAPGLQGWTVEREQAAPAAVLEAPPEVTPDRVKEPEETPAETPESDPEEPEPDETPGTAVEADEPPGTTPEPEPTEPVQPEEGFASRPGGVEGGLSASEKVALAAELAGGSSPGVMAGDKEYSEAQGMAIDPNTGKDKYLTDPVPEGKPLPVEPQDATISDIACTCTLSISCATILDHMDWLDPEKAELVPDDGWILPPTQVTFYEGESVFNVLQRTCKQNGIHMEFSNTPMYNSAYIEGIHNLYEFDCGELSGWMYKVNEWFPNYGCSRYQLKEGDVICWVYTCDLGVDVGGFYSTGG
ncbi:MAG: DUF4430 domain-containing protein [Butyricicoccus sp.]|nr:DUF4430 domain-containing protein [Butyricicoccus sp.]